MIQVIGTAAAQALFESAGPFTNASGGGSGMIAAQNATLQFDAGLTNQAALAFSYGVNNVFGTVTNSPSGNITVAGGAGVTFYGDVAQNGTLVVSTVGSTHSSAVFLGAFSGSGGFTGGGDVFIEGNLRPSDPVEVTFGGNAYLGSSTDTVMQLAGPLAGSQYDQINVTGQLVLAGISMSSSWAASSRCRASRSSCSTGSFPGRSARFPCRPWATGSNGTPATSTRRARSVSRPSLPRSRFSPPAPSGFLAGPGDGDGWREKPPQASALRRRFGARLLPRAAPFAG